MDDAIIEGGFTSRTLFIHAKHPKHKIAWGKTGTISLQQVTEKLKEIKIISDTSKTIEITKAGRNRFKRWYNSRRTHSDAFRGSFEGREDSHILRLAACLCINDGSWCISPKHINTSIDIIGDVKTSAYRLFTNNYIDNKTLKGIDKLRSILIGSGIEGITQRDLYRKVNSNLANDEYHLLMEIMQELQMVDQFQVMSDYGKRSATMWRATKLILDPKGRSEVMKMYERNL